MKKEKSPGAMKKFIKKMAIAVLTGAIAFSVVPATVQAAGWKQNKNGYWWQENDYSYPKNQWKTIYGKQYHFNSKGYMDIDWTKVDGKWYYFGGKNDGAKKTYWQQVRGKYYWLGSNGVMRTGWQNVYGKYYWLGGSNDGAMKTGWQKVGGKYYLLGKNGDMKSGWQTVYGKKYYLGSANDGSMKTGWQKIGGSDYYFGRTGEPNEGVLRTSTWVGNYYVDSSGRWDKNKSVDISDYLSVSNTSKDIDKQLEKNYANLKNALGMNQVKGGTMLLTGKTNCYYNKDKVYLAWTPSREEKGYKYAYTVRSGLMIYNQGTSYAKIYGITTGNSISYAKNTLKSRGWTQVAGYDDKGNSFHKVMNNRSYLIEFEVNSAKNITRWSIIDYPQGDAWDIPVNYSLEDSAEQGVVMESPQQESDTTEAEIPDTEANSEEPALPETTEQETSDATQNENNTTEIEEEQATQEEQVSEEESTEETQQVEENKEENQSSEMINE